VQGDDVPGTHTKSEGTQTEQHAPKTHWHDPHLEGEGVFGIGTVLGTEQSPLEHLFRACGGN
jgi:hypothetical protein